jgi:mannose-6-phosphate isomerase
MREPLVNSPMLDQPLVFEPIFMERVWGGRRLESLFGKRLPAGVRIGESWEIVDRPEAQSVVHEGSLRGETLHDLWMNRRPEIFGDVPDSPRFPILVKLLDAQEKLSIQVHPPAEAAEELGGEPKTEFWYIAETGPAAELYVGLKRGSSRTDFAYALEEGSVVEHVHRVAVSAGDAMFLPSGRVHAVGAGNVIVEIQQNSDTTYRIFDWERSDRELHIEQAMRSVDFNDIEPSVTRPQGESLVRHELFHVEKWHIEEPRLASERGRFAIVCCIAGALQCGNVQLLPGNFALIPASLPQVAVKALADVAEMLRVTIL